MMISHSIFVAILLMNGISSAQTKKAIKPANPDRFSQGLLQPMDFSRMATPKAILDSLTEAGVKPEDIRRPAKKFLLNLYNQLQHGGEMSETLPGAGRGSSSVHKSLKNADTVRSLTAKVPVYEGSGKVKLTFNLSSLSNTEVAHHAELHIRPLQHQHENHRHKFRFTVLSESGRMGQKMSFRLASKSKTYNGYLVFDITGVIQQLINKSFRYAEKLLEIRVSHKAMHGKRKRSKNSKTNGAQQSIGKRSLSPLVKEDDGILLLYTKDNSFFEKFRSQMKYSSTSTASTTFTHDKQLIKRRRKRTTNADVQDEYDEQTFEVQATRVKRSNKKECGVKEFIVDFEKLGWNKWIVFPHTYNAFMCTGRCSSPVDWSLNPTNHAILQSLMRLSDRTVPKPCCVPTKLEPLSMIYFEYEEIVVRHHEGMVVSKCGCR